MRAVLIILCMAAIHTGEAWKPLDATALAAIDLSDAAVDDGWVCPVAADLSHVAARPELAASLQRLRKVIDGWAAPSQGDALGWTFALLNAAALVDLGRGDCEAEANRLVIDLLLADARRAAVVQATARIAVDQDGLTASTTLPELGLSTTTLAAAVHDRVELLARKVLGRLLGTLPPKAQ